MTDTGTCQKQRRILFELGPRYRGRLRSSAVSGATPPRSVLRITPAFTPTAPTFKRQARLIANPLKPICLD